MPKSIAISEAESRVMDVLWRVGGPAGSEDVVKALSKQQWQETTVKTLLSRLLKKGAIKASRDQRRYLYVPVLTREQWLSFESTRLLDRLFGGRVAPLVAHFGQHHRLSKQDIADLKRLIAEMIDEG
ncbi:MAG: BlaI/MecI/CopY family transcriptional regulator [Steroidobacteraceae bacterium]